MQKIITAIREQNQFEGYLTAISPDNRTMATVVGENINLYETSGTQLSSFSVNGKIIKFGFSNDSKQIIAVTSNDIETDVSTLDLNGRIVNIYGHSIRDPIRDAVLSPDGQFIACLTQKGTVSLWHTSGRLLQFTSVSGVTSLDFDKLTRFLLVGEDNGSLKILDLAGNVIAERQVFQQEPISSISFGADEDRIAITGDNGTVGLYTWNEAQKSIELNTQWRILQQDRVDKVFIDDQKIITTSEGGSVRIYDLSGTQAIQLHGHAGKISSIVPFGDGRSIITASDDNTVRLWNISMQPSTEDELLNSDRLVERACDWLSAYLKTNVHISQSDQKLCN